MIRRTLCDELRRDDTNWKAAPRHDLVEQIVENWTRL
jgi:hypothetical protein